MATVKKLAAIYMMVVAAVVGVFFVVNPLLNESIEVSSVWYVLDVLMLIGLVAALIVNSARKWTEGGRDPNGPVTRRYLEINAAFYLTVGVTILFLHNWFSFLAFGEESLDGNDQAWVIWAFVDVVVPLALGVTGYRLWRQN